jgi:hypothetical protein
MRERERERERESGVHPVKIVLLPHGQQPAAARSILLLSLPKMFHLIALHNRFSSNSRSVRRRRTECFYCSKQTSPHHQTVHKFRGTKPRMCLVHCKGYEKLLVTPWCAAHFSPAPVGISALCSFYYLDAKQNVQSSTVAVADPPHATTSSGVTIDR